MKHFTTRDTRAQQSGYVLPMALLLIVLTGIILTSVTTAISRKWNAVEQELYVQQELMTYNPATTLLDLCMADLSPQVEPSDIPSHCYGEKGGTPGDDWYSATNTATTSAGDPCDTALHSRCWRVLDVDPIENVQDVRLVSDIGNKTFVEIHVQVAVGCHGAADMERDCGRLGLIERYYYRNTFLQYQVHYNSQYLSDGVKAATGLSDSTVIAFVTGDEFNGPVRLNSPTILYCGTPTFGQRPPTPPWNPSILVGGVGFHRPTACLDTSPAPNSGALEREDTPLSVEAAACETLGVLPVGPPDKNGWADARVDIANEYDIMAPQPPRPAPDASLDVSGHPGQVLKFDVIDLNPPSPLRIPSYNAAALTVHGTLQAGQSVAVVATGDIIVSGDLITPNNPRGETGLIALISQCGDVLIQPNLDGAACLDSSLHPTHNITLRNVAVLAPNGSMWMPDWDTPRWPEASCPTQPPPDGTPTFTFEGSVAAGFVGLYGEANDQGVPISGWSKIFTYPEDDTATPNADESFWLRRPLWWPEMSGGEWLPFASLDTSVEHRPALLVNVPSLTVDEGGSDTFTVNLNTAPSAGSSVTVSLVSDDPAIATVTPASLTFTDTDFDVPQTVTVNGTEDDADQDDESTTVTLTGSNGGYDAVVETVTVDVTDDEKPNPIRNLVVTCPGGYLVASWDAPNPLGAVREYALAASPEIPSRPTGVSTTSLRLELRTAGDYTLTVQARAGSFLSDPVEGTVTGCQAAPRDPEISMPAGPFTVRVNEQLTITATLAVVPSGTATATVSVLDGPTTMQAGSGSCGTGDVYYVDSDTFTFTATDTASVTYTGCRPGSYDLWVSDPSSGLSFGATQSVRITVLP